MTTFDIRGTVVGETAVAIKAPCLVATTDRDSPRAIRWIERLGFVRASVQPLADKWLFEWTRDRAHDLLSE